jgi:RNA recognition motif-containing protein
MSAAESPAACDSAASPPAQQAEPAPLRTNSGKLRAGALEFVLPARSSSTSASSDEPEVHTPRQSDNGHGDAAPAAAGFGGAAGSRPTPVQDPQRTVFVGGLPPSADVDSLRFFFSALGTVSFVRVRAAAEVARIALSGLTCHHRPQLIRDPQTGRSKRYAFVTFEREPDAASARALGCLNYHGARVTAGGLPPCESDTLCAGKFIDIGPPRLGSSPLVDEPGEGGETAPAAEASSAELLPAIAPRLAMTLPSSFRVFVCNLPREATEAMMVAFFSMFGPVVEFKMVYDPTTGFSKRFGFAGFVHRETADVLKAMKTVTFMNHNISLSKVRPSEADAQGAGQAKGVHAAWDSGGKLPPPIASMIMMQAAQASRYMPMPPPRARSGPPAGGFMPPPYFDLYAAHAQLLASKRTPAWNPSHVRAEPAAAGEPRGVVAGGDAEHAADAAAKQPSAGGPPLGLHEAADVEAEPAAEPSPVPAPPPAEQPSAEQPLSGEAACCDAREPPVAVAMPQPLTAEES